MGAIAAAVSKKGENVVPQVALMLKELKHRGAKFHRIITSNSMKIFEPTEQIERVAISNLSSNIVLGHNLSQTFQNDSCKPMLDEGYTLAFEGHIFPSSEASTVGAFLKKASSIQQKNCADVIRELEGSYVFGLVSSNSLIMGRDTIGTTPLYYGKNETIYALASELKALWKIGITNTKSFPPGNLARIDAEGFAFQPVQSTKRSKMKSVDMDSAAKHLQNLLTESTRKRVSDIKKIAVAFSGGLDSSIIAVLAKLCKKEVHLISVGLDSQEEIQHAKEVAEAMDIPHHVRTFGIEHVREILPRVLWLIEQANVVNTSIAIPFYWIAEIASQIGCPVLLAGQGGDELFGGYQKYLANYAQGIATVNEAMYHDIAYSYETNFQRDNKICAFHKVDLRLPFTDRTVIEYALSLPVNLKIESAEDLLRKRVLRKVAQNLKLSSSIANRKKKAIQYATGVNKSLRKLAKEEGLTLQKYVEGIFQKAYPEVKT